MWNFNLLRIVIKILLEIFKKNGKIQKTKMK